MRFSFFFAFIEKSPSPYLPFFLPPCLLDLVSIPFNRCWCFTCLMTHKNRTSVYYFYMQTYMHQRRCFPYKRTPKRLEQEKRAKAGGEEKRREKSSEVNLASIVVRVIWGLLSDREERQKLKQNSANLGCTTFHSHHPVYSSFHSESNAL